MQVKKEMEYMLGLVEENVNISFGFIEKENAVLDQTLIENEMIKVCLRIRRMLEISKDAFENLNRGNLPELTSLGNEVDGLKKELIASHFIRLAEGSCNMLVSLYYSSVVLGLERVADHLVNVGYSIVSPVGSQKEGQRV